jgi:hypothetical protein
VTSTELPTLNETALFVRFFFWLVKRSQSIPWAQRQWFAIRSAILHDSIETCHHEAMHGVRDLSLYVQFLKDEKALLDGSALATQDFCNSASRTMAKFLGSEKSFPHCALKLHISAPKPKVLTIGRSSLNARRGGEYGFERAHFVRENTVFSSIMGLNDGKQDWHDPVASFCCNNLSKHRALFACTRKDWERYYNSTLAYPVRFRRPGDEEFYFIGFLTFDFKRADGFPSVPCIFDHYTDVDEYEMRCRDSSVWHLGAFIADACAATLLPLLSLDTGKIDNQIVFKRSRK